jgi:hypothetical protein
MGFFGRKQAEKIFNREDREEHRSAILGIGAVWGYPPLPLDPLESSS